MSTHLHGTAVVCPCGVAIGSTTVAFIGDPPEARPCPECGLLPDADFRDEHKPGCRESGAYRKVGALIVRDRRMLVITASANPGAFSMPGGPTRDDVRAETILRRELIKELGVHATLTYFGDFHVTSDFDGARVEETVYRAEIEGEPEARQPGRDIAWIDGGTQLRLSTMVRAVLAEAINAGLVRPGVTSPGEG